MPKELYKKINISMKYDWIIFNNPKGSVVEKQNRYR